VTAAAEPIELSNQELDPVALKFLSSDFARYNHPEFPVGQQLDAFLLDHGINLVDDQLIYDALLQCVIAHLDRPLRTEMAAALG
jgi:hypothetical protein